MRRFTTFLLIPAFGLLLGSTCVEPDIEPVPRLGAPVIIQGDVTVLYFQESYHEMVRLEWTPPETEHNFVAEYQIIRTVYEDSGAVIVTGIPDTVTEYYGRTDHLGIDRSGSRTVYYRVFTIDTQGTVGDTSAPCSISVAPYAVLHRPDAAPPLGANRFTWSIQGIATPFITRMALWDTTGKLYQGAYHDQQLTNPYGEIEFNDRIPDTLYPLPPGPYWWGAELHIFETLSTSVKIGAFHVGG